MKKLLLFAALIIPSSLLAQSVMLVKMDKPNPEAKAKLPVLCYTSETYANISDKLFKAGNPKYVWVDLLKDGLVTDGDNTAYNLYISTGKGEGHGTITIPEALQKQYTEKWIKFAASLGEKTLDDHRYDFHIVNGITSAEVMDRTSALWKTSKAELHSMHLTTRGEIRFYEELIKDGLATPDKPLTYEIGTKGFTICGTILNAAQKEKYTELFKEEFGNGFYGGSNWRWSHGPLPENILSKELAELRSQLVAINK